MEIIISIGHLPTFSSQVIKNITWDGFFYDGLQFWKEYCPPPRYKIPPRKIATLNISPGLGLGFGVGLRLGSTAIFWGVIFQGAVFLVPFLRHYQQELLRLNRNYSDKFLLKTCPELNNAARAILVLSGHFRQVFVYYVMSILMICKYTCTNVAKCVWLHLSSSLWVIPLCSDLFRKRLDQENFLLQQQITELYYLFDGL